MIIAGAISPLRIQNTLKFQFESPKLLISCLSVLQVFISCPVCHRSSARIVQKQLERCISGRIEARVGVCGVSGGDRPRSLCGRGSDPPQIFRFFYFEKAYFCRMLSANFNIFIYNEHQSKYI